MNDLITINHEDYGLAQVTAETIKEKFRPVNNEMTALMPEYEAILLEEITEDVCIVAKKLGSKFAKTRTATAKIHKEEKAFFLAGGKYVQEFKNKQFEIVNPIETTLANIANHFINIEKAKIEKLQAERWAELEKYMPECSETPGLGEMESVLYDNLLSGAKKTFEDAQKAFEKEQEQKAEEERKEKERIAAMEIENAKLRKEQAKKDIEAADLRAKLKAKETVDMNKSEDQLFEDFIQELRDVFTRYSFKSKKYMSLCQSLKDAIKAILNK